MPNTQRDVMTAFVEGRISPGRSGPLSVELGRVNRAILRYSGEYLGAREIGSDGSVTLWVSFRRMGGGAPAFNRARMALRRIAARPHRYGSPGPDMGVWVHGPASAARTCADTDCITATEAAIRRDPAAQVRPAICLLDAEVRMIAGLFSLSCPCSMTGGGCGAVHPAPGAARAPDCVMTRIGHLPDSLAALTTTVNNERILYVAGRELARVAVDGEQYRAIVAGPMNINSGAPELCGRAPGCVGLARRVLEWYISRMGDRLAVSRGPGARIDLWAPGRLMGFSPWLPAGQFPPHAEGAGGYYSPDSESPSAAAPVVDAIEYDAAPVVTGFQYNDGIV